MVLGILGPPGTPFWVNRLFKKSGGWVLAPWGSPVPPGASGSPGSQTSFVHSATVELGDDGELSYDGGPTPYLLLL